jgi:cytoskeletal protein RodZ
VNSKTPDQTSEGGTWADETDGSLGEQLRRMREARGISLRDISEQTRITMRHLEAIETNDYKHLPGGIFNRSFVKAYAKHIDFDEQRALDLYALEARERGDGDDITTTPRRARVYTGDVARSPAMTAVLSFVILGILVLIVYAALHWYKRSGEQPAVTKESRTTQSASPEAQTAAIPAADQTAIPEVAGFKIEVKAKDRPFWLTTRQDEAKSKGRILNPTGQPEQFEPKDKLYLLFGRASADSLDVRVNGRAVRPPVEIPGAEIEWNITKDNYKQFLP